MAWFQETAYIAAQDPAAHAAAADKSALKITRRDTVRKNCVQKVIHLLIPVFRENVTDLIIDGGAPRPGDDRIDDGRQVAVSGENCMTFADRVEIQIRQNLIGQISAGDVKYIIYSGVPEACIESPASLFR